MKRTVLMFMLFSPMVLAQETPAGLAPGGNPYPADLPPLEMVQRVLLEAPDVQAANAQVRAEEANRDLLRAGPYEWTVRVGANRRKVQGSTLPTEYYREGEASLERTFRLPGKGSLDRELGEQGVKVAEVARGDARHEAARGLLQAWFNWRQARARAADWAAQQALLVQQANTVKRREQLGDAARLERVQAEAAAAQATAALGQARAQERVAEQMLLKRYPGLVLPRQIVDVPVSPLVGPVGNDENGWMQAILDHSHELHWAEEEARRMQLVAGRSERNFWPDPTLGVRSSRERGGDEQVTGLFLSIPLPGAARRAGAAVAREQATAAELRAEAVRRRVQAEAAALWQEAQAAAETWQASQDAAERLEASADMTARAYALGEGALAEVLLSRRLAHEARLNATQAKLTAQEKYYRLQLDTHRLWDFDDEPAMGNDENSAGRG